MPYIHHRTRKILNTELAILSGMLREKGEYNYVITRLIHGYILRHGLYYSTLNDAVGILECAKQELLRTVVGPYEDKKREANGNISILDAE